MDNTEYDSAVHILDPLNRFIAESSEYKKDGNWRKGRPDTLPAHLKDSI
jgi:hypothetical protein